MTIRGYGACATGVLGAIFGFDLIWNLTSMEALKAFFAALMISLACVAIYAFATEPRQERRPRYRWVTDEATGLSIMVRGGRP